MLFLILVWIKKHFFPALTEVLITKQTNSIFVTSVIILILFFTKKKRWQLSSQVELGTGLSKFEFLGDGTVNNRPGNFMCLYNPAINIKFKIFKWLGLGSTIGYRFMLINESELGKQLNSPLYSGGILIWWDELALALFPKSKKINSWLGPPEW